MSLVHVASTVVSTPTPSPTVVKELITTVISPKTPSGVLSLLQTLALAGATAVVSLVHQLVVKDKINGNTQRAVVAGYVLVGSLLAVFLTGHFGTSSGDVNAEVTSFLVALGAALGRYEYLYKSVLEAMGATVPGVTDTPDPSQTATPPAQG